MFFDQAEQLSCGFLDGVLIFDRNRATKSESPIERLQVLERWVRRTFNRRGFYTEGAVTRILLIDDDADLIHLLREELASRSYAVDGLERAEEGPDRLASGLYDLVLLDNKMPGMTGMDFLKALRTRAIAVPVILITSESTPDTAIQATKLGAFDYVVKSGTVQELAAELDPIIGRALEIARPQKEVRVAVGTARAADAGPVLIGGKNRRMLEVYKLIAQFADGNDPVLILGETGTGKELVARAFHTNSSRG